MQSPLAQGVYLAVLKDSVLHVGWPKRRNAAAGPAAAERNEKLFALTNQALQGVKDFFDARRLLGVHLDRSSTHVMSLVALTRKERRQWAGLPWRPALRRWRYDKNAGKLNLTKRGTLHRVKDREATAPPKVVLSDDLWKASERDGVLEIGEEEGKGR